MAPIAVTATLAVAVAVAGVLTLSGAALRERLKQTKQNQKEKKMWRYNTKSSKTRRADTYCSYRYGLRYRYGRRYRYIRGLRADKLFSSSYFFIFIFYFSFLPVQAEDEIKSPDGVGSWNRSWATSCSLA